MSGILLKMSHEFPWTATPYRSMGTKGNGETTTQNRQMAKHDSSNRSVRVLLPDF